MRQAETAGQAQPAGSTQFREQLAEALRAHFAPDSGATECLMALLGAFYTASRALGAEPLNERDRRGVAEMLYAFSTGLVFGNQFWQRASVVLTPLLAVAQLNVRFAAAYYAAEAKLPPDSPEAMVFRRRVAECVGSIHDLAIMALVIDRGLSYAEANGTALRDALDNILSRA